MIYILMVKNIYHNYKIRTIQKAHIDINGLKIYVIITNHYNKNDMSSSLMAFDSITTASIHEIFLHSFEANLHAKICR